MELHLATWPPPSLRLNVDYFDLWQTIEARTSIFHAREHDRPIVSRRVALSRLFYEHWYRNAS